MGDAGESFEGAEAPSNRASLPSASPTESFWQTSHPNPMVDRRSTPDLPMTTDIVIIGSGITGVFVAKELLNSSPENNFNVLVLEARTTCSGATGRNGGHLQPMINEEIPGIIDFELRNLNYIYDLVQKDLLFNCDIRSKLGCHGYWNKAYFEEAKQALHKTCAVSAVFAESVSIVEDPEELEKLRLKGAVGAIIQTNAASLSPYHLVILLWQDLVKKYPTRLNLQTTTPVLRFTRSTNNGLYTLHTDRGDVRTKQLVLATNGYTSHLLSQFENIIVPTQGQMSALIPTRAHRCWIYEHTYGFKGIGDQDRIVSDYLVQLPIPRGALLMYGGARGEVLGQGFGVSDDSYVDMRAQKYLRCLPERLQVRLGGPHRSDSNDPLDIAASWTGIMGFSKDHFPWVGGMPGSDGLWVCAGYSGHGMPNASLCGRHLARLVLASLHGQDWQARERESILNGDLPEAYAISQARFDSNMVNT